MGCSESKPEGDARETTKSAVHQQNQQPAVPKPKNKHNCPTVVKPVEVKKHDTNKNEATAILDSDTNINSTGDSWEVLTTKKEKPTRSTSINVSGGSHRRASGQRAMKPRELRQVQPAWGRKSTTIENNFLEDLRLLREKAEKNVHYEKSYDATGEDRASRFINKTENNQNRVESSHSDLLSSLSLDLSTSGEHEESFDASKIIDVQKFRAANLRDTKKISEDDDVQTNNMEARIQSQEHHRLNSSPQDVTSKNEENFAGLYNEEDEHLIESIEQEFVSENYYLPGQIVN